MKVLFIGGTGVISYDCSKRALEKGIDLYLLNRGKSVMGIPDGAKVIYGDIRDTASVKSAIANHRFDVVVDWIAYTKEHVQTDYELFKGKTGQYIFISSASVYEKPIIKLPLTEETPLGNKFWAYARAKIECENYLRSVYQKNDFPITIVRPSHTYNKTKNLLRADYLPFYRMKNGKPIIIHDDGNSLWTLTHSKDFAKGFIGLLGRKEAVGEAYQITSHENITWNKIAETLANKAGYELKISHIPSTFIKKYDDEWGNGLLGDKAYSVKFDNSKIKKLVPDFNCAIPFESGAEEVVDWFVNRKENQFVNENLDSMMDRIISDYNQGKN